MTDDLTSRVARYIDEEGLVEREQTILVGLSGGADSVVLAEVLLRLGFDVAAAHVNYGLRGEASEGDERFVRAWCGERGVPLRVRRFETAASARASGRSVQEEARRLRYDWFAELAAAGGFGCVAVGHHRDDQIETLLLQLFRGAGPEGLAGMAPARPLREGEAVRLVRPLLGVRRAELEAWARRQQLAWRTDASNVEEKYRRGALREAILPLVADHFGEAALENVARAADLLRAYADASVEAPAGVLFDALAERVAGGGGRLALPGLRRLPEVWRGRIVLEALRRWMPGAPCSAAVVAEVAALVDRQPGRRVELAEGAVWRERGFLLFIPRAEAGPGPASRRLSPGETLETAQGTIRLEIKEEKPERLAQGAPAVAFLDADRLSFPLEVRPWRAGDRIRPLGMAHTKLVSDVLTDARVPSHRKAGVHVVVSDGRIVWIAGQRLAHDVRVRRETQRVAEISILSHDLQGQAGG